MLSNVERTACLLWSERAKHLLLRSDECAKTNIFISLKRQNNGMVSKFNLLSKQAKLSMNWTVTRCRCFAQCAFCAQRVILRPGYSRRARSPFHRSRQSYPGRVYRPIYTHEFGKLQQRALRQRAWLGWFVPKCRIPSLVERARHVHSPPVDKSAVRRVDFDSFGSTPMYRIWCFSSCCQRTRTDR